MVEGKRYSYKARGVKKLKRVKNDYQQKSLHNPFFRHRNSHRKAAKTRKRLSLFVIILFLILAASIYFFIFSPVFSLRHVKILGISRISEDKLAGVAWQQSEQSRLLLFKQTNLLFFKTDDLAASLNDNFSFDSLHVYKQWPHTIVISAGERSLTFIWRDRNGQNFSDNRGCLVREVMVTEADLRNYPILENTTSLEHLQSNDCLDINESYLKSFFSLYEKMKNYPDLQVDKFLLEDMVNTIKADLSSGPNVLLNTKEDLDKQLNNLIIIRQEKTLEDFQRLDYIDLRFGDKVFFK